MDSAKKQTKELTLSKKTIQHLTNPELKSVAGGAVVEVRPPMIPLTPVWGTSWLFPCPSYRTESISCCNF